MRKAIPFAFYFLYFAAAAALIPFVVLYYQQLGFSGAQIGLLAGMAPLIAMVGAPLWTNLADRTGRHRLILSLTMAGVIVVVLVIPSLHALLPVVGMIALYSLLGSPIVSLSDSATMTMLGDERDKYGRVRLGGTFGWALAAPLAGLLVENNGIQMAFYGYATFMALALVVSQRLVFGSSADPTGAATARGGMRKLLSNRRWALFLAMAFVCGMGFASVNTYLFAYMQELGASAGVMGLALTLATLSELPVLFFADRLLKRMGSFGLLTLGMAVTGVRLLLFAAVSAPAGVLAFQFLNGLTFPAVWVSGVSFAYDNAPPGLSATAQGLFGAMVFGFGAAAGGLLGGLLLEAIGSRAMYLVFGVFVLLSLALLAPLERRLAAAHVS
ncbi:MAG TPA: MFS transporter [Anaerolineae bacterium]|nr:MFS transporter [Anaerolineae bacterium]